MDIQKKSLVLPPIIMSSHSPNHQNTSTATATVHPSQAQLSHQKAYPPPEAKYEEIAQNPDAFLEKLKGFHGASGTKFKVPTIGGRALDLYRLFLEVTTRGGIEKVIRDRKWKEVTSAFSFPSTITSASFVLRKYYLLLLYHFEQAYYFRKEVPSILNDSTSRNLVDESAVPPGLGDGASTNQLPVSFILDPGSSVIGTIDAKFDSGYLVTVKLGSEKLKGVLYHTPLSLHTSKSYKTSAVHPNRNRKRYQLASRDPSRPKPNRSGYNFFFSEHYTRLKPLYHGKEKAIAKKIAILWSRLTDSEKQVYQDKGLRDKERYKSEMLEYSSRSSNNNAPAAPAAAP